MYGCMLRTIVCAGGFFEGGMFFFSGEGGRRGGGVEEGRKGRERGENGVGSVLGLWIKGEDG